MKSRFVFVKGTLHSCRTELLTILCALVLFCVPVSGCHYRADSQQPAAENTEGNAVAQGATEKIQPGDSPAGKNEEKPTPPPLPELPDSAWGVAMEAIKAIQEYDLGRLWYLLPESYRKDLQDAKNLIAADIDPEAYNALIATLDRTLSGFSRHQKSLAGKIDPQVVAGLWLLHAILEAGDLRTHEGLVALDIGQFLLEHSKEFVPRIVTATGQEKSFEEFVMEFSMLKVTVRKIGEQETVLRFNEGTSRQEDVTFVKMEGQWVPQDLVRSWSGVGPWVRMFIKNSPVGGFGLRDPGKAQEFLAAAIEFERTGNLEVLRFHKQSSSGEEAQRTDNAEAQQATQKLTNEHGVIGRGSGGGGSGAGGGGQRDATKTVAPRLNQKPGEAPPPKWTPLAPPPKEETAKPQNVTPMSKRKWEMQERRRRLREGSAARAEDRKRTGVTRTIRMKQEPSDVTANESPKDGGLKDFDAVAAFGLSPHELSEKRLKLTQSQAQSIVEELFGVRAKPVIGAYLPGRHLFETEGGTRVLPFDTLPVFIEVGHEVLVGAFGLGGSESFIVNIAVEDPEGPPWQRKYVGAVCFKGRPDALGQRLGSCALQAPEGWVARTEPLDVQADGTLEVLLEVEYRGPQGLLMREASVWFLGAARSKKLWNGMTLDDAPGLGAEEARAWNVEIMHDAKQGDALKITEIKRKFKVHMDLTRTLESDTVIGSSIVNLGSSPEVKAGDDEPRRSAGPLWMKIERRPPVGESSDVEPKGPGEAPKPTRDKTIPDRSAEPSWMKKVR